LEDYKGKRKKEKGKVWSFEETEKRRGGERESGCYSEVRVSE
jgi:hypothetical protein